MRIEIPENKRLVHESIIPIRWGDMDAYRHINNTIYFRYMEQARIEWIAAMGYSMDTTCLLYTSPSPRDRQKSRMPSSA